MTTMPNIVPRSRLGGRLSRHRSADPLLFPLEPTSGSDGDRLSRAIDLSEPQMILFLDEPSWMRSGLQVRQVAHHINDPHRPGQVYEGFWGRTADGRVVGKAPQHPHHPTTCTGTTT